MSGPYRTPEPTEPDSIPGVRSWWRLRRFGRRLRDVVLRLRDVVFDWLAWSPTVPWLVGVLLFIMLAAVVFKVLENNERDAACVARGGVWFCSDGGANCICLRKDQVLP